MNYEFEIEKLKGWKVYYTNMYKKTGRNTYYVNLEKIMYRFMSMRTKILVNDLSTDREIKMKERLHRIKDEMYKQSEEIRRELGILKQVFAC